MRVFKLPRKKKKQYKKDNPIFYNIQRDKANWEWFYFKRRVEVRNMEVIIDYPNILTNEQLLNWYITNYPNDKIDHMYCLQNRHKWDKFNNTKSQCNTKKYKHKLNKQLLRKFDNVNMNIDAKLKYGAK